MEDTDVGLRLVMDRNTNKFKGIAFLELSDAESLAKCVKKHQTVFKCAADSDADAPAEKLQRTINVRPTVVSRAQPGGGGGLLASPAHVGFGQCARKTKPRRGWLRAGRAKLPVRLRLFTLPIPALHAPRCPRSSSRRSVIRRRLRTRNSRRSWRPPSVAAARPFSTRHRLPPHLPATCRRRLPTAAPPRHLPPHLPATCRLLIHDVLLHHHY